MQNCPICGKPAENPFKRLGVVDGQTVIRECCVGVAHDRYVVPNSNHSAFVRRARKAGIDGRW